MESENFKFQIPGVPNSRSQISNSRIPENSKTKFRTSEISFPIVESEFRSARIRVTVRKYRKFRVLNFVPPLKMSCWVLQTFGRSTCSANSYPRMCGPDPHQTNTIKAMCVACAQATPVPTGSCTSPGPTPKATEEKGLGIFCHKGHNDLQRAAKCPIQNQGLSRNRSIAGPNRREAVQTAGTESPEAPTRGRDGPPPRRRGVRKRFAGPGQRAQGTPSGGRRHNPQTAAGYQTSGGTCQAVK